MESSKILDESDDMDVEPSGEIDISVTNDNSVDEKDQIVSDKDSYSKEAKKILDSILVSDKEEGNDGVCFEPNSFEDVEHLYDQFEIEDDENYLFERIVDHYFDKGVLHLKVKYIDNDQSHIVCVPFGILKNDVPLELARYIKEKVIESSRRGFYSQWAKKVVTSYSRIVKRMHRVYRTSNMYEVQRTRRAQSNMEKASNNKKYKVQEKFGIKIPRNVKEALLFDKENKNSNWSDAIYKEMEALKRLKCFKFHSPDTIFKKSDGWQYAPLHMIFDIKQQDMRYKARLVAGGNVVDSSAYNTNSTTVHDISVRLLVFI